MPDRAPPRPLDAATIADRRQRAGRIGFVIGAAAALIGGGFNAWRAWDRLTLGATLILTLVALLNIPLFIGLSLLAEKMSRDAAPRDDR
jgi:hypothetical protein